MRTVSIFRNGKNQSIRIPIDMGFDGVSDLIISKEGETITMRPARPTWSSLADVDLDTSPSDQGDSNEE